MSETTDQLVSDYLRDLRNELSDLPRTSRQEVLDEIGEHIADARNELGAESESAVRNVLERLGDPAAIADEARDRFGVERRLTGWREIAALVLLPVGGLILPVIGWFVGLVLLWVSDAWTTRQKLLGTLVFPGGLLVPVGLLFVGTSAEVCTGTADALAGDNRVTCTGGSSWLEQALWLGLFAVLAIAPIAVAILLARRMRRPPAVYAA